MFAGAKQRVIKLPKQAVRQEQNTSALPQTAAQPPQRTASITHSMLRALGNRVIQGTIQLRAQRVDPGMHFGNATVSEPGDRYEQEAERTAKQVVQSNQPTQLSRTDDILPPSAAGSGITGAHTGSGTTLDATTQQFFESRFGYDFGNVRLHTDTTAAESARQLGARAYTHGNHISFGSGEFHPSTSEGKQLLAHELAHVVQQTRSPDQGKSYGSDVALSAIPSATIQRKLVATGDAAGFAALANAVIAVQVEVVVGRGGEITLRNTQIQGPPTPEAQVLVATLRRVIDAEGTTSIEFIHGATSVRVSDQRVLGGSFPQSKVDLDDEAIVGTQESLGLGQGATAGALLAHEIEEQYRKQQLGQSFDDAHAAALAVEAQAVGAARVVTQRAIPGGTEITYTYSYPGGRVVELKFDVINGNRTNIRRTVRP